MATTTAADATDAKQRALLSFDPNRQYFTPYRLTDVSDPLSIRSFKWDQSAAHLDDLQLKRAVVEAAQGFSASRSSAVSERARTMRLLKKLKSTSERVAKVKTTDDFEELWNAAHPAKPKPLEVTPPVAGGAAAPATPAPAAAAVAAATPVPAPYFDLHRVPPNKLKTLRTQHAYKLHVTVSDGIPSSETIRGLQRHVHHGHHQHNRHRNATHALAPLSSTHWWRQQCDALYDDDALADELAAGDDDDGAAAALHDATAAAAGAPATAAAASDTAEQAERLAARMRKAAKAAAEAGTGAGTANLRRDILQAFRVAAVAPHMHATEDGPRRPQQHQPLYAHTTATATSSTATGSGGEAVGGGNKSAQSTAAPAFAQPSASSASAAPAVHVSYADSRRAAAMSLPTAPAGLNAYIDATLAAGINMALRDRTT